MFRFKSINQFSIIKSIRFNLRYLPLRKALKMPIFIGRNVSISHLKGEVELKVFKPGIVRIGFGPFGIGDVKYERSIWDVQGKVIFNGKTHFGHGCRIGVQKNGILRIGDGVSIPEIHQSL